MNLYGNTFFPSLSFSFPFYSLRRLPLSLILEGAARLARSLIVTKLLKGRGGHAPKVESQYCRERHVVTEFILVVYPRARGSVPSFFSFYFIQLDDTREASLPHAGSPPRLYLVLFVSVTSKWPLPSTTTSFQDIFPLSDSADSHSAPFLSSSLVHSCLYLSRSSGASRRVGTDKKSTRCHRDNTCSISYWLYDII